MATKNKVKSKQATTAAKALVDKIKKESAKQRRSTRRSPAAVPVAVPMAVPVTDYQDQIAQIERLQTENGNLGACVERLTAECNSLGEQLTAAAALLASHFDLFANCEGQQVLIGKSTWVDMGNHWRQIANRTGGPPLHATDRP